MAVDKKSDYYTSPDNYRDNDGNMRTFTYVDHDKKTKVNTTFGIDTDRVAEELREYRSSLQSKILALPASVAPSIFSDFRTVVNEKMAWITDMILDEGTPLDRLQDIYILTTNRWDLLKAGIQP